MRSCPIYMRELGEREFGKVLLMQAKVRGITMQLRCNVLEIDHPNKNLTYRNRNCITPAVV